MQSPIAMMSVFLVELRRLEREGEKNNLCNDALCVALIQHRLPFGFMFFLITIAIIACVFRRALAAAAFRFRDS